MGTPPALDLITVLTGGGAGACCRYGISRGVVHRYNGILPLATASVNLSGSMLLGLCTGMPLLHVQGGLGLLLVGAAGLGVIFVLAGEARLINAATRLAIAVGFLGGFTTWSTLYGGLWWAQSRCWTKARPGSRCST